MTSTDRLRTLSPAAVSVLKSELEEYGYSVVRGVVPKQPLIDLNARLVEAYERFPKFEGGGTIAGHLNCYPGESARFIYDELEDYGIVPVVRALRSGKSTDLLARVNYNLPGSSAQHYHMDSAFMNEWLLVGVAIVDTDEVNGAMDVLPTTHREYYPFWKFVLKGKARLSTRVLLEQGDVLVRTSALWHRGMPNKTQAVRPMMSLSFGEPSAPPGDPFGAFGTEISFYPNWYNNASRLGVIRERVETALPITRSTLRFAKSLVRPHGFQSYS